MSLSGTSSYVFQSLQQTSTYSPGSVAFGASPANAEYGTLGPLTTAIAPPQTGLFTSTGAPTSTSTSSAAAASQRANGALRHGPGAAAAGVVLSSAAAAALGAVYILAL